MTDVKSKLPKPKYLSPEEMTQAIEEALKLHKEISEALADMESLPENVRLK